MELRNDSRKISTRMMKYTKLLNKLQMKNPPPSYPKPAPTRKRKKAASKKRKRTPSPTN